MLKVGIILGSTRPNRNGEAVAKWVEQHVKDRNDASYELVDLKDFNLPLLDEPIPPSQGKYSQPHTRRWAEKIAGLDAFIFVGARKVFYQSNRGGKKPAELDFSARLPLWPGSNRVTVVVRENDRVQSSHSMYLYRDGGSARAAKGP